MKAASRLAGNILWLGLAEGVPRLASFGIQLILIRRFLPADYGSFGYAYSLFALLVPAMNLGLPELLVREGARGRAKIPEILSEYASLKLLAAGVFLLLIGAIAAFHGALAPLVFWVGVYLLVRSVTQFLSATFRALERMEGEFVIRAAEAALLLALGAVLARSGLSLAGLVAGLTVGALLLLGAVFFSLRRAYPDLGWRFEARAATRALREAYPFGLAAFLVQMYLRVDVVMLKRLLGDPAGVGYYASAVNGLLAVSIAPALLTWALFPALSRRYRELPRWRSRVFAGAALFGLFGVSLAGALALLARPLVVHLFGGRYLPAIPALAALAPALAFLAPNLYLGTVLASANAQRDLVWIAASSSALKVAGNLWAVPAFGYVGAAWVTVGAEAFATMLYLFSLGAVLRTRDS